MSSLPQPPRWANRFLGWFCSDYLREEIEGDLYEAYQRRLVRDGKYRADQQYVTDVFRFFKPYAFEKYSRAKQFLPMLDNCLKIALRNIWHRKGFTAINLFGLGIGVAAVVLIAYYLRHELTYDQNIPQSGQVYRLQNGYRDQVYTCMSFPNYNDSPAEAQKRLLDRVRSYEGVEAACHFITTQSDIGGGGSYYVGVEEERFVVENFLITNRGAALEQVFPQDYLLGDPVGAFTELNSIILTERLAYKWFGPNWQQRRLVGKTLVIEDEAYSLSAVVKDRPSNEHFNFEAILQQAEIPSWGAYTYFKISPAADIKKLTAQLNADVDLVYPDYSTDELSKGISAVALTDIHFTGDALYELKPTANRTYLRTFGLVGFLILLIIWINYTNLSVAMYADRQRELGMRKVLGARSQDVSLQLLAEATSLSVLALPLVLLLVYLGLPYFNELMGTEIVRADVFSPLPFLSILGLLLLTGLISGAYPAVAYGQRSALRLFGKEIKVPFKNRYLNLRNGLLGVQFFLLVSLLSFTTYIYQQMQFVNTTDLGFQKEGVLYFGVDGAEKYQQLKTKLASIPEIEAVGAGGVPGAEMFNQTTYQLKGREQVFADATEQYLSLGSVQTLQLDCESCQELMDGKERIFLINRTAAEKLARINNIEPEALIGEVLITEPEYENERYGFGIPHVIDGIIDDYKYFSLKYESQPIFVTVLRSPSWVYQAMVRAKTDDWSATLAAIQTTFESVETVRPFNYTFLEDRLDKLYVTERRSGLLLTILCFVAVVLAMMGLAGVVAYIAYRRQKEIGIRKVLGASVGSILLQFNKEFLLLLGIAAILALPSALFLAKRWLSSFALRIEPQPLVVLGAGLLIGLLVIVVVSMQARRAAVQAPMDNLRKD